MNLRKDHCRDPYTKQTVNASPVPPGLGSAQNRTNGALGVKEHLNCLARRSGRPAFRSPRSDDALIHTTLGNGYLGSRIDEERSKMRYLV